MTIPTFMIVPSLACQASCKYCFGPHEGSVMDERTARETIRFIHNIAVETAADKISIIFHGGEPLLAPLSVWEVLLDEIKKHLGHYKVKMNLQSNLWELDENFLKLFCENDVSIGTSVDGPKEFCDLNRGEGYFDNTYASIKKANAAGCPVSAIATITKRTLPHTQEIAKYFRNNGMPLVLHGALAGIEDKESSFALSSDEFASMIKDLFPWYINNRKHIRIDTLDHYVRGIVMGNPGICTFQDCLGMFLAISPTGDITSCQRLAGKREFSMGNIFDRPSLDALYKSQSAMTQREREKSVAEKCKDCDVYPICKGGCYYNSIVSGDGVIDPLCQAYKGIYLFVQEKIFEEMKSTENIEAVASRPATQDEHPLLRKGEYISLSYKTHPARIADNARRILALYELSKTNDPQTAAQSLFNQKICGDTTMTSKLLANMQADLYKSHKLKNNCYIHVTFDCNLRCNHCYADAGDNKEEMKIDRFEQLVSQAISKKFRQVVVTGGEPLVHSQCSRLVAVCEKYRDKGTNLVLRTNLTGSFSDSDFVAFAKAFDQVVVSVDGNEQTHDARRGTGTYNNVVKNLEKYTHFSADIPRAAELSLASVMSADDINNEPGQNVNALGERLKVKRIRFKPLLPIGRASHLDEPVMCEGLIQHISPEDMLKSECKPRITCGIGQNLFVKPDGAAFPCYAWCGEHTYIGNVFDNGLDEVLTSRSFEELADCTVDTILKCRDCEYRYLCGGACRAWGNQQEHDLNAPPVECGHLKNRAEKLICAAREYVRF